MITSVRYFTRSGNTEKLAFAIADALSAKAESVSVPLDEKTDILFLGCSYYGFDIDEAVKSFVAKNSDKIGKIVCFGTSAMMKSTRKPMQKVAHEASVCLDDAEFHCRGSFGPLHKGRPNEDDLKKAVQFALNVVSAV